jgi:uncharacterized protein (DUF4415 family)
MTTGIEFLKLEKKRTGRGPSKNPTLLCTSLRLPKEVLDYFLKHHPHSKQAKIREVLSEYVNNQLKVTK